MAGDPYLAKGAVARAYLDHLAQQGKLESILARLPPGARAVLSPPPLPGTWVPASALVELTRLVLEDGGDEAVLELGGVTLKSRALSSLIPMVQGVLRVFGTSPAAIYGHFGELISTSVRGVEFAFAASGASGGVMTMRHLGPTLLHRGAFLTVVPGLEVVLQLCGRTGAVEMPVIRNGHEASFRITW